MAVHGSPAWDIPKSLLLGKKLSGHDFCRRLTQQRQAFEKGNWWAQLIPFPRRLRGNPDIHFNLLWTAITKLHAPEFHCSLAVTLKKHFLSSCKTLIPFYCTFLRSTMKSSSNNTLFLQENKTLRFFLSFPFAFLSVKETVFSFSGQYIDQHVYSGVSLPDGIPFLLRC